ncbi:MAG: TfoX/Sxy family protein [SAR202 cluster bacterium]|nr:TfoX/Sxy family protein [SAR202 cluster bacterium]
MAFDEELAARISKAIGARAGITEKRMFGGIAFMLDGKMFVGVIKDELMARVGPEGFDDALRQPGARPMDFTGKPMGGYVYVSAGGLESDAVLRGWMDRCAAFVATLPAASRKRAMRR